MKQVTILIPAYNEEKTIPLTYKKIVDVTESLNFYKWELLFVDDGSTDATLNILKQLRTHDQRVKYIRFSRNFGKESAMLAGFDYAKGDCVIVMDADMQDPPELIGEMLEEWEKGAQDVYAKRTSRGKESIIRRHLSLLYYRLLAKISDVEILQNVGDFRLLDRRCVDALCQMRESQRYTKGLFCWIGFQKREITFERQDRIRGHSSWNLLRLTNFAIDGITSFSIVPLRISAIIGFLTSGATVIYMFYFLIKTLLYGDPVQGFPTLIVVILLLGGLQLCSLGIIGEYIGRIYNETKKRPVYIVSEKETDNEEQKVFSLCRNTD